MYLTLDAILEVLIHALLLTVVGMLGVWCGVSERRWYIRVGVALALGWAMVPTEAAAAIVFSLLYVGQVGVVLSAERWFRSGWPRIQLSVADLSLLILACGVLLALLMSIPIAEWKEDHPEVTFSALAISSAAAATAVVVAVWITHVFRMPQPVAADATFYSTAWRLRKWLCLLPLAAVTAVSAVGWHFGDWYDSGDAWDFFPPDPPPYWPGDWGVYLSDGAIDVGFSFVHVLCACWLYAALRRDHSSENTGAVPHRHVVAKASFAGCVLLCCYFYGVLLYRPTLPPTDLPNPNGHDLLLKAAEPLQELNAPSANAALAAHAAFILEHRASLELARRGLALECRMAVPRRDGEAWFDSDMAGMMNTRELGRLFRSEAVVHVAGGDQDRAAASLVDGIRLGQEWSRGGLLIHAWIGKAIEHDSVLMLMDHLDSLTPRTCKKLARQLEQLAANAESFDRMMEFERAWSARFLGNWRDRFEDAKDRLLLRRSTIDPWSRETMLQHDTIRQLLIAELAVRAYRAEKGNSPPSLADLVPAYVSHVPIDPFAESALLYQLDEGEAVVYSVGPDRVDDHGKSLGRPEWGEDFVGDLLLETIKR